MKSKWKIDPAHSEIQFKAKHLMITTVTGHFGKFNLTCETEDNDFTTATNIVFTADIQSINTNNEQRDTHLRSADFFDYENFKELQFKGKKFAGSGEDYTLTGDLTIRAATKPVTVKVHFGGIAVDAYGQTKAGFEITGKVSRKEFGLRWNGITEAGQVVVSDEIRLACEIQLIKQPA
jgi:polyisoprenoid-binding protein YceI